MTQQGPLEVGEGRPLSSWAAWASLPLEHLTLVGLCSPQVPCSRS